LKAVAGIIVWSAFTMALLLAFDIAGVDFSNSVVLTDLRRLSRLTASGLLFATSDLGPCDYDLLTSNLLYLFETDA
jgi:hypothetical protein